MGLFETLSRACALSWDCIVDCFALGFSKQWKLYEGVLNQELIILQDGLLWSPKNTVFNLLDFRVQGTEGWKEVRV